MTRSKAEQYMREQVGRRLHPRSKENPVATDAEMRQRLGDMVRRHGEGVLTPTERRLAARLGGVLR